YTHFGDIGDQEVHLWPATPRLQRRTRSSASIPAQGASRKRESSPSGVQHAWPLDRRVRGDERRDEKSGPSRHLTKVNCPAFPARGRDQRATAQSRPTGSSRPTAARSSKPATWRRKARATHRRSLQG